MSTTTPSKLSVLGDIAVFFIGWALLFKQAGILFPPPKEVSEMLVIGGMLMIGTPGVANLLALRFGTGSPSPSSPPAVSPPPSGSSSGTGGKQ